LKTLKSRIANQHGSIVEDGLRNFPFSIENCTKRDVPIHQLKAQAYLKIEGICETLLYGDVTHFFTNRFSI
jgi:hypothetical protein